MSGDSYRDPFQSTPRRGDFADHGAYQKPLVPLEERIELHIARILKDDGRGHRVFEVECVAHSVRFSSDKSDPELNPATDILIRRRDIQSPDYKVRLAMGDGTAAPVSLKLPIEVPRMVLKVYGDEHDIKKSANSTAHMNAPLCWGTSPRAGVEPCGFQLGTWSLTRYVTGMTFASYLEATSGDEFDPEAVWADRCYCLAGVADRLAEMRTVKGVYVHSDIKPSNIVVRPLTADGVRPRRSVELIDIDTLVYLPIAYGGALTPVLAKGCTPRFAPPETLLRGLAERSSDVWSFGIVVFDALVGRHPFGFARAWDRGQWEELYRGQVEPNLDGLLSHEARGLVRRCLDKNPLNRPEPAWLAAQLRELALHPPVGYVPKGPDVEDATTEMGCDVSEWQIRYCVELEPEVEEAPEVDVETEIESEPEAESEPASAEEPEAESGPEGECESASEDEIASASTSDSEPEEEVDEEDGVVSETPEEPEASEEPAAETADRIVVELEPPESASEEDVASSAPVGEQPAKKSLLAKMRSRFSKKQ